MTDKGLPQQLNLLDMKEMNIRSYVSEPDRGRRNWQDPARRKTGGLCQSEKMPGRRDRRLMRSRELIERSPAHEWKPSAMRRTHLKKHNNILKRLLVHTAEAATWPDHAPAAAAWASPASAGPVCADLGVDRDALSLLGLHHRDSTIQARRTCRFHSRAPTLCLAA